MTHNLIRLASPESNVCRIYLSWYKCAQLPSTIFPIITTIKHPTTMAEARRVVIDLIDGEENEDVNVNDEQPRHTFTSEDKANLSRFHGFLCPFTLDAFEDPVVARDGRTYSRGPLGRWLSTSDTSPITREVIAHDGVYRNIALQTAMEEVARNMKNSDEMEKKTKKATELMRSMLDAEIAKVKKLENDMTNMAETIQTMKKEHDNNDLKWELVVDHVKKKSEMEKATLVKEYQTKLDMGHAGWEKAVADNKKILKEKEAIEKKLATTKNDLKTKRDSMEAIAGMLKDELEKAPTNRKSNKKVRR